MAYFSETHEEQVGVFAEQADCGGLLGELELLQISVFGWNVIGGSDAREQEEKHEVGAAHNYYIPWAYVIGYSGARLIFFGSDLRSSNNRWDQMGVDYRFWEAGRQKGSSNG